MWTGPERVALVERAMGGDKNALLELRAMLDAHPESERGWTDALLHTGRRLVGERFGSEARLIAEEMLPRRLTLQRAEL
jgi:hypothetical protein